jgi:hypothetical protein
VDFRGVGGSLLVFHVAVVFSAGPVNLSVRRSAIVAIIEGVTSQRLSIPVLADYSDQLQSAA